MDPLQLWCKVAVIGPDGTELTRCELEGPGTPDLGTVDQVARLALLAGRLEGHIALDEVSASLRGLLELAGLYVEVEGQTKLGEETLRIQE
jgi:hypothetical protein